MEHRSPKVNPVAKAELMPKDEGPSGISKAFIANFVHQVVNPLNGVIGTLDNIVDGTYASDTATRKLNACRAQVEQCVTLIRNLAFLSEYFGEDVPSPSLKAIRTDVRSVLPQVVIEAMQFFQVSADRRNIKLNLTDRDTQYKVYIRPELLKQVFINLFDNWVKYGIDSATVEVIPRVNAKGNLMIEMSGRSIGFNNNDADKIFEFGYRAASAESKIAQGSGIGLFICKQIITRELNGKISAVHSSGQAVTTFRIAIPEGKWVK
jgi:signal transduction histidine kinase